LFKAAFLFLAWMNTIHAYLASIIMLI